MPSSNLGDLHHAYLLVGSADEAYAHVHALFDRLDIRLANNPDFVVFRQAVFGIDDARGLKELALRRALNGVKIFLILPAHITIEAQNALLKTFEDPLPHTHFFLGVREAGILLPTLLSRMRSEVVSVRDKSATSLAQEFIASSVKDRLVFARKFADDESDPVPFLDQLLLILEKRGSAEGVEKVFNLRKIVNTNIPAPRLLLEHLALVI
jgi:hypothetical protein